MKTAYLLSIITVFACSFSAAAQSNSSKLQTSKSPSGLLTYHKKAASGNEYLIINPNGARMAFTVNRPSKSDSSILLCIAAAFTGLADGKVDGAYAVDGKVIQEVPNMRLGGAILLNSKGCKIFPYHAYPPPSGIIKDPTLSAELQKKIKQGKYSFFQQIQVVVNGQPERFWDEKVFQRRAIVAYKSGKVAVIESKTALTLAQFSKDLVNLGAHNALYTDMGDWDEGWYRDADGQLHALGTSRRQTEKQSNWIIFTTK